MTWADRDPCRVVVGDRTLEGVVDLVVDGRPCAVRVDGMIDGLVEWVPVLWKNGHAETLFGTLIDILPVTEP